MRTQSKKSAHERACAAPGGEAHAQRSSRGGGRCEENMRTVTYAFRVALRGRPLRSGASTSDGARTTSVAAAVLELVIAKRPAPIPDQPRRLHDAGQHGHHQHPHDLPPCRPAASHAAHRVPLRLNSRPVMIERHAILHLPLEVVNVGFFPMESCKEGCDGSEKRKERM